LAQALHMVVVCFTCMDDRGYDTFWTAERHVQPKGTELIPNILMLAMHLCSVAKRLKIVCGCNIAPIWHPLRLAEDYGIFLTGDATRE
jgi:alkanesulfonate monooxygenase SsuD/methylene tetrahydromethanopterin reductase-like flavin-dependent oxidoreductase (luciferase family)